VADEGEIHQHSGWLIPLTVLVVVALLCAALLLYYMRPFAIRNTTAPFRDNRASTVAIPVNLAGMALSIPRRYFEPGTPRGGRNMVALVAALPDMRGFSEDDAQLFANNAPDSPLVHLLIRADRNPPAAGERLSRIYMPYIANAAGEKGPFGLTRYIFRPGSGYARDDLYAGGALLLLCEQPAQDLPSPNCLAIDQPIAPGVSLSYRFKRAQMASWRAIDDGVNRLVAKFRR
jgi:hypothetical protein